MTPLLAVRHSGTGNAINIEASGVLTPRDGILKNLNLRNAVSTEDYAIRVFNGSCIEFHNIGITGGKGVIVTGDASKLTEFLWFNKIRMNGENTSFEITHGCNLYLTEIDTNDSDIGLSINNSKGGTFNIFVNRFNSARCNKGIQLKAITDWITRVKISEATISGDSSTTAGIYIDRQEGFGFTECIFDNINIDSLASGAYAIQEENNSMSRGVFTNIRTSTKVQLRSSSKFTWSNIPEGGVYMSGSNATVYTIGLAGSNSGLPNSVLPGNPIVVVTTNQTIPFQVATSNTQGGICNITVTFASAPSSNVVIYYYLTGYYYTS